MSTTFLALFGAFCAVALFTVGYMVVLVRDRRKRQQFKKDIRELRLAIEGKVTSRDPDNPKLITGVEVTGVSLVPQDNEMESAMREAATYDAEKLEAHRELWDNLKNKP
jgi:hypothetical protein